MEWKVQILNGSAVIVQKDNIPIAFMQDGQPLSKAQLISATPELYEACKEQHEAIDILFARLIQLDNEFFPSKSGKPWEALVKGKKALAKAEGK